LDLAKLSEAPLPPSWDPEHPERWVHNDLSEVAVRRIPELAELQARLRQAGAVTQSVSGSGPTVFGLFATWEGAREAARVLRRSFPGWLAATQGLTGGEPTTPGSIVYG
jgi:4-diphosphocytidyl-2-C-methyl-D-erythritol kinase